MLESALKFAKYKHRFQKRKSGDPYVVHTIETGKISREIAEELSGIHPYLKNDLEEIEATGILHDTIEDTGATFDEIRGITNERVASWVALLSDDKRLPRDVRHQIYALVLKNACLQLKIIKLADIYSNLKSLPKEDSPWIRRFIHNSYDFIEMFYHELGGTMVFNECLNIIKNLNNKYDLQIKI